MDRLEQEKQQLAQAMAIEDDDWDAWLGAPDGWTVCPSCGQLIEDDESIAPECGMCDKLIGDALIEAQTWAPDEE